MKINFRFWFKAMLCIACGIVVADALKIAGLGLINLILILIMSGGGI